MAGARPSTLRREEGTTTVATELTISTNGVTEFQPSSLLFSTMTDV